MVMAIIVGMSIDILASRDDSFYQQEFVDLVITGEMVIGREFEDCRFERCRFVESGFEGCTLVDCTFEGCELSGMQLTGSTVVGTRFVQCKLMGVDWTRAASLGALQFERCNLSYSLFNSLNLKKLRMARCVCKECDFEGADLTNADFEGTDLEKSVFARTNLTNAGFRGARNYSIDLRNNTVKRTKFSLPEAVSLLNSFDIVLVDPPEE